MMQQILNEISNTLNEKYVMLDRSFRSLSFKDKETGKQFEVSISESYIEPEPEPLLTMPRGSRLFYGDYMDEYDGHGYECYVVGRTYDSAFDRFYKDACDTFYSFTYEFDEIDDEEEIDEFVRYHGRENIKAGLYKI